MCRSFTPPERPSAASASSIGDTAGVVSTVSPILAQHLARLLDVVRSRRWAAFERIALPNPRVFRVIFDAIPNLEEFEATDETLIHFCLRHDPPLGTMVKMMNFLPDVASALRARDCMGRMPLHVAAAWRANANVIKLLGSVNPTACTVLDEDSRTPLHLACDSTCNIFRDEMRNLRERMEPSYDAALALLSESLEASLVEDKDGMSALECAIVSNASIEVVTLLQKAMMEVLRERYAGGRHEL